jgi:hypothetical protein
VRVEKIGYPVIAETATLTAFARGDKEGVIARGNNSEAISISTKNNIVGATLVVAQNNKRGRVKPCPYIYGETATLTAFARGDKKSHFSVADKNYMHLNFTGSTHSVSSLKALAKGANFIN